MQENKSVIIVLFPYCSKLYEYDKILINIGDELMKKLYSLLVGLIITASLNIAAVSYADNNILSPIKPVAATTCTTAQVISVKPLEVVKNPEKFLNKKITMISRFSKFSTLGLDYKPALRSSDNYISFLFLREDAANNIPLSELKMFIPRPVAEKLPDIKEGDTVKVVGTVFSDALGDAWIDVNTLEEIKK